MKEVTQHTFEQHINELTYSYLYLYTPMCGTCQVAAKMLTILKEVKPSIHLAKADLNFLPGVAEQFEIESVPCLLLFHEGELIDKIYAFQSVPYLLEKITLFENS